MSSHLQQLDFYESTLNSLSEGIVWTDQAGTIAYANEAASRWLGHARNDLLDQSIFTLLSGRGLEPWLAGNPSRPLILEVRPGEKCQLFAVVSLAVGDRQYNCFLLKEDGSDGKDPNEMLRIISEGTASVIGGDFFKSLAYHVILSTGIRYAIVTECADEAKTRVRTLVYVERKDFLDNFEYDLVGTPCELVMKGEDYFCTADMDTFFPKEEGIKSYFGVPIYLSNGEVIGHIAIFDTQPMVISDQKLNILKIFASRAGAEIERKR
jgi:hypothetical protein